MLRQEIFWIMKKNMMIKKSMQQEKVRRMVLAFLFSLVIK